MKQNITKHFGRKGVYNMKYKVTYYENIPIYDYRVVEHTYTITLCKGEYWYNGGLIYYRANRFNVKTLAISTIKSVVTID